jgi:hypothetical protein
VVGYSLYFALVYPGDKDLKNWQKAIILFLPYTIGPIFALNHLCATDLVITSVPYLYVVDFRPTIYFWLYQLFSSTYLLLTILVVTFKIFRHTGRERIKLFVLLCAFLFSAALSKVFTLLLPMAGLQNFHTFGPVPILIAFVAVAYDIVNYRLFNITPSLAGDEILSALGQRTIISDLNGKVYYGKAGLEPDTINKLSKIAGKKGQISHFRALIDGKPFSVAARLFRHGAGVVMVCHEAEEIETSAEAAKRSFLQMGADLEKDRLISEVFVKLALVGEEHEVDKVDEQYRKLFTSDPDTLAVIDEMGAKAREKARLLKQLQESKDALAKKLAETEEIHRSGVKREQIMIELKNKIKELKEAKNNNEKAS